MTEDVVVVELVEVGLNGSCWVVAAPSVVASKKAAAANERNLVACFIRLFSNPGDNLIGFRGQCKQKPAWKLRLGPLPAPAGFTH